MKSRRFSVSTIRVPVLVWKEVIFRDFTQSSISSYGKPVIQDKEEEADEIIAQYDDYLFCLRSLKNISPLLKQIIAELSTFIDDKQDRYIFTEITSGAKILDVAKRISLPVTSLTLSPYIRKCLQKLELETMEDLLRYARKKGLDSLLKISGFGPLGLDQFQFLEAFTDVGRQG